MSSNPTNKLIFLNTSIKTLLIQNLLGGIFWLPFIINLGIIPPINLINSFNRLNQASLNCSRDNDAISCSLTGKNMYGNIEQVISYEREKLIEVKTKIFNHDNDENETDDLIILITSKKEIFLLTQKSIIKDQVDQINAFLDNPRQKSLKIQTKSSRQSHIFTDLITVLFTMFLFYYILTSYLIYFVKKYIVNTQKYILDKDGHKISIKRILTKDVCLEIDFETIKQVHLVYSKDEWNGTIQNIKILLVSNDKSILLSIDLHYLDYRDALQIAISICSFLKIPTYQIIEVPP